MNMNRDIINRALYATGQNSLSDSDIENKNTNYELCKSFYLATFLEALSEVEWVGGRKREKLLPTGRPITSNQKYKFAYDMPFDCAKPIELQDNEFFIVEDRLIFTNIKGAELLFVSNGKVLRPVSFITMKPGDLPDMEYLTAGPPGTVPEVTLYPGRPSDIKDEMPEDPEPASDYPDYIELQYEAKFYEYIEKKLAAKFAMKASEQPRLHSQLLQEALLIKQEAIDATRSSRAAKVKEDDWWSDELGMKC